MPKLEAQTHMDESVIFNGDFEAMIESYLDTKPAHQLYEKARKAIKAYVTGNNLEPGLYRCGPYTFTVQPLAGGGFHVPEWESKGVTIKPA